MKTYIYSQFSAYKSALFKFQVHSLTYILIC